MGISEKIRRKLMNFLRIHEWNNFGFDINRQLTFEANAAKNAVWYNGDSYELSQLFAELNGKNGSFWGATETTGLEIRKMHTGLPRLIVNTLANITCSDISDIYFEDEKDRELWQKIKDDSQFKNLITSATRDVLKIGDGAFKISYDCNFSDLPIIEFYSGEHVDFVYNRNKIAEIKFYNKYEKRGHHYVLEETYGYGYIKYQLYKDNELVPLNEIKEGDGLVDVYFDNNTILAVPYMITESSAYKGRGQSVFDGKTDAFDALDEVLSQWMDAIRSGRVKTYIPKSLIPRDSMNGSLLMPNSFDNKFIKIEDDMSEGAANKITTEQPNIQVNAYESTYITNLDLALQGLISPSTLGIDVKKLDNAESQREKEKTTLYTRRTIIEALSPVIEKLVVCIFRAYYLSRNEGGRDPLFTFSFGEYANPSFEAVVETMSNPNTPMSIEAKVEEIWGDSKSTEWKALEVERIKQEQGIFTIEEPSVGYIDEN